MCHNFIPLGPYSIYVYTLFVISVIILFFIGRIYRHFLLWSKINANMLLYFSFLNIMSIWWMYNSFMYIYMLWYVSLYVQLYIYVTASRELMENFEWFIFTFIPLIPCYIIYFSTLNISFFFVINLYKWNIFYPP